MEITFDEEKRSAIETLARAICEVDGVDPDLETYMGEPMKIMRGYVASGISLPAWTLYSHMADAAFNVAVKRGWVITTDV
jgi:hypothetical protein